MSINDRLPPRPSRPAYSVTMKAAIERQLAIVCGNLGCLAIEARALWQEGDSTLIAEAVAGACDADVARLKRIKRRKP